LTIFKLDSYCERVNFQWSGAIFAGWLKQDADYQKKFWNSFRISSESLTLAAGRPNSVKDSLEISKNVTLLKFAPKFKQATDWLHVIFYYA
jgi:hypothetical protein